MEIIWNTISVKDMAASRRFYEELLGFRFEREFSPSEGTLITFLAADNGSELELLHREGDIDAGAGKVSIGIAVQNFDELFSKCGATRRMKMPTGMECFFIQDPDGVTVQIVNDETL